MKLNGLIAIICIVFSCFLTASCTKDDAAFTFASTKWTGTYPVQTLNNDTNELEDHMGTVSLQFNHSGLECSVETGIAGLLAVSRTVYDVKWYSDVTFTLCETKGGQTIQYYSGTIKGSRMTFEFLSCDKVERTVELEAVDYK